MNDRFKFRVWDEEFKEYVNEKENPFFMKPDGSVIIEYGPQCDDGISGIQYINATNEPKRYTIEFCLGISAVQSNRGFSAEALLIYDGDITKYQWGHLPSQYNKYVIKYVEAYSGYMFCTCEIETGNPSNFYGGIDHLDELQIIGNIHDEVTA